MHKHQEEWVRQRGREKYPVSGFILLVLQYVLVFYMNIIVFKHCGVYTMDKDNSDNLKVKVQFKKT